MLLWLWCRPAAVAPTQALAWGEPSPGSPRKTHRDKRPHAVGVAIKKKKKKKKKKKILFCF